MKTPHKHAELIKAWADGAEIEYLHSAKIEWIATPAPEWLVNATYRIKPEPKPEVVEYRMAYRTVPRRLGTPAAFDNLKLTFDGETGKLKAAEVL